MEAVPRLPMISFDLKVSPENAQFGPALKQYIANFYGEDPESYNTEINNLECLRSAAVRPTVDVSGCQLLKKYYCQLHFLQSRFPMNESQAAAVFFCWKDNANMPCTVPDIRYELMCILYNIGALHTQLGATDGRTSPDGLKMACTHFQCAAWAFQTVKEKYHQMVCLTSSIEAVHFMQQVCLAQAQECILEKSMMDNRKATITAKIAVQVVDHYKRALTLINSGDYENSASSVVGSKNTKEWIKYLSFKVSYHKCIALLFQGQQAEELQKMGERVAFYQAACEQLEEARNLSSGLKQQKDLMEAIAFTSDVVEGKRKAAKNENEFIYHEEVPERSALQEVKGASLVKGIAFNVNDVEVSGSDIFARLVPMEAHEAASLYSEKKAQKLRQLGELVEAKDQALAEFMSSLQLDVFTQMRQATGLSQDLVDRAAALSARPTVTQDLVAAMGKLSNSYHEVEAMLNEIQELLKEEENSEKEYQEVMGKRPPSIVATDLSREAMKYREAHTKANDSNQNLHKAMMTHVANLKILAQPLLELKKQIPSVELPNPNIDEDCVKEIEGLIAKVDEMRNQRAMLWSQLREAIHKDDITGVLVTRPADQSLDQLFQQELQKHQELTSLIEQNVAAQENILKAFVDAYARSVNTRRYLQDVISRRNTTVTALITSFDTYEDLISKANKGIDFYNKLETNVAKLLQRIKSASKVQQEEREQMLKSSIPVAPKEEVSTAPKLKDYLDTRKKRYQEPAQYYQPSLPDAPAWPPAVRPAPLGSEMNNDPVISRAQEIDKVLAERMATLRASDAQKAFTVTTNMYQPISSSVQDNQAAYAQPQITYQYPVSQPLETVQVSQPNEYYPSGYGPNAQLSPDQPYSYNSLDPEYITSVRPNISVNNPSSTYSSPTVDMKSSTANGNNYVMSNGKNYPSYDGTGQYQYYYTNYSQEYPNYNYVQANESSIEPSGQSYSGYTYTQTSDGYGYAPANLPVTSSEPNVSYGYGYTPSQANLPNVQNFGSYTYTQSQTSNYGYQQPQGDTESGYYAQAAPVTKESNIDLLTGLDFTVNQAPLIPQQKVEIKPAETTKEAPKPVKVTKEEVVTTPKIEKVINRKSLTNVEVKKLFLLEVDKYEKFVDVLTNKTLNGPTNLELKWKEIVDQQDIDKKAISVARCYPMKNRFPDILPYDYSRVELKEAKDDYINASYVKDVSYYSAPFIVTQAPLPSTISDFWTMIKEQQVELIVSLLSDTETGGDIYWPKEKGRDLSFPGLVISLVSITAKPCWIERLISVTVPEKRDSRVLMHLQFTAWPGSLFPTSPDAFVAFVTEVTNAFLQQRSTAHPVVVHCLSGIGRSGLLCLLMDAVLEVSSNPQTVPDLVSLTIKLSSWRRNILRDREHLKFAYEAFLAHMKQVVALGQKSEGTVKNEEKNVEVKAINDDPLSSLDPFWASKKGT